MINALSTNWRTNCLKIWSHQEPHPACLTAKAIPGANIQGLA